MDSLPDLGVLDRISEFANAVVWRIPARQRELALTYLFGLLAGGERKSVEPLMRRQSGGERRPARERRMRAMLSDGDWSAQSLMQAGAEEMAQRSTGWMAYALDDTAILKRGPHSVGVTRQYAGCVGRVISCQSVVTMSIAQDVASALVRAELFMPESWFGPRAAARRIRCHVPSYVSTYQSKAEIALDFVRSRQTSELPKLPYVFDSGYGVSTEFRDALSEMGEQYVASVLLDMSVWPAGTEFEEQERKRGAGRPPVRVRAKSGRTAISAEKLARALPAAAWQLVHWRDGSRGPQRSRFAAVRVRAARGADARGTIRRDDVREEEWLLVHWPEHESGPTKAWLSNLPADTSVTELVRLARVRWRIERDHQECKELLGFDHYEGRTWRGLHHHLALVLLSQQSLTLERLRALELAGVRREPALFPPVAELGIDDGVCACCAHHRGGHQQAVRAMPDLLAQVQGS